MRRAANMARDGHSTQETEPVPSDSRGGLRLAGAAPSQGLAGRVKVRQARIELVLQRLGPRPERGTNGP